MRDTGLQVLVLALMGLGLAVISISLPFPSSLFRRECLHCTIVY